MISQSLLLYTIVIMFGVVLVSFLIIIVFHYAYADNWTYKQCVKKFDMLTCSMIFPPLRFEAV